MKWIMIATAALIALIVLATVVGAMLPRNHVASRTIRLHRTPDQVWTAYTQATAASSVPVDVIENDPPRRMVTRVKETEKMFGGTWTCVVTPVSDGATITITEDGWVANPFFRFVSRFIIGHHATMDGVLKQMAATLNEEVR